MGKSVLLLNHHLVAFAGSELVTFDLASYFLKAGWEVTVATFSFGTPLSTLFAEIDVPVYNVLHEDLPLKEFDLIWAHHFPIVTKCLLNDRVQTKRLVLSSLSPFEPLETLPLLSGAADLVLANSEETRRAIHQYGFDRKVIVFPNSVSDEWFVCRKNSSPTNGVLRSISVVSNHPPSEMLEACELIKEQGIQVDIFGLSHDYQLITPDLLVQYDAVITIGRTVQHAMALRVPVFCYDHFGGPGWITTDNYQRSEQYNYSGRCTPRRREPSQLLSEFVDGYLKAYNDIDFFYNLALERYRLSQNVSRVLQMLDFSSERKRVPTVQFQTITQEWALRINNAYLRVLQELHAQRLQVQETEARIADADLQIENLQRKLRSQESTVAMLENTLSAKEKELSEKEAELHMKNKVIEVVLNSRSWRVTAPLRKIISAVKRSRD